MNTEKKLNKKKFIPEIGLNQKKWDVHSVLLPEENIDFKLECNRLKKIMNKYDCVNIFLSEGFGIDIIISEKKKNGEKILKDAFGHVRLDDLNPGKWFAKKFGEILKANKILIQKSGYFSRSSKANKKDLDLIFETCDYAVKSAIKKKNGVIGRDEEKNNSLSCIDFNRIKGGKNFDTTAEWYVKMIKDINTI